MTDGFLNNAFDFTAAAAPGNRTLNVIFLCGGILLAVLFVAYLIRCYIQEFQRQRRLRKRCRPAAESGVFQMHALTFAPPKRKTPQYLVTPTIHYTVTASSGVQLPEASSSSDGPQERAEAAA